MKFHRENETHMKNADGVHSQKVVTFDKWLELEDLLKGRDGVNQDLYFLTMAAHSTSIGGMGEFKKKRGRMKFSDMVTPLDEATGRVMIIEKWEEYRNQFPLDAKVIMDTGRMPDRKKRATYCNMFRRGDLGRFSGWNERLKSDVIDRQLKLVEMQRQRSDGAEIEYMKKHAQQNADRVVCEKIDNMDEAIMTWSDA